MTNEEKAMVSSNFIKAGHPIYKVLKIVDLGSSTYYYKSKTGGKPGRPYSAFTLTESGQKHSNNQVLIDIQDLFLGEFVDYGYLKTTHWLRQNKSYIINPKKVYRLMSENGLLNKFKYKKKSKRNWVKDLLPPTKEAFDYQEFDIKYVYIAGTNTNALVLTVICVKTRWVMGHYMANSIKEQDVIELFTQIYGEYPLPKSIYVRNDNGSQFIANSVQKYFKDENVTQEFCKPATPQQNAHIESYHSIMECLVCQRYEFKNINEGQDTLNRFVNFYNFERIHSGVGYTSPYKYLLTLQIDMKLYYLNKPLDCKQ